MFKNTNKLLFCVILLYCLSSTGCINQDPEKKAYIGGFAGYANGTLYYTFMSGTLKSVCPSDNINGIVCRNQDCNHNNADCPAYLGLHTILMAVEPTEDGSAA